MINGEGTSCSVVACLPGLSASLSWEVVAAHAFVWHVALGGCLRMCLQRDSMMTSMMSRVVAFFCVQLGHVA